MKVRNENDFVKTIIFEHLAQTSDVTKFMLKSYITFVLNNSKKEVCCLYAVGKTKNNLKTELEFKKKAIVGLFKKVIKDGKWIVSTEEIYEYDGNGNLIDYDDFNEHILSSRTVIKKETEYFIKENTEIESKEIEGNYIYR